MAASLLRGLDLTLLPDCRSIISHQRIPPRANESSHIGVLVLCYAEPGRDPAPEGVLSMRQSTVRPANPSIRRPLQGKGSGLLHVHAARVPRGSANRRTRERPVRADRRALRVAKGLVLSRRGRVASPRANGGDLVLVDLVLSGTIALVAMNNGQDDWFGL
jgi:hypothetical protein